MFGLSSGVQLLTPVALTRQMCSLESGQKGERRGNWQRVQEGAELRLLSRALNPVCLVRPRKREQGRGKESPDEKLHLVLN